MSIVLSKFADPADFDHLVDEAIVVERYLTSAQPSIRRWEYAMALRAACAWRAAGGQQPRCVYDVGGTDSSFRYLAETDDVPVHVVDPKEPDYMLPYRLDQFLGDGTPLGAQVFCLSVLEHVDDLDQFCYHLSCLTAPGGLLFLTMAAVDRTPPGGQDLFFGRETRRRIFTRSTWLGLIHTFCTAYHCELLGDFDQRYAGPQVADHSVASIALVKRR